MKKYKIILTQSAGEDDNIEFHSLVSGEFRSLAIAQYTAKTLQKIFPDSNAVIIDVE